MKPAPTILVAVLGLAATRALRRRNAPPHRPTRRPGRSPPHSAFLATLDAGQRAKANIELNAKTRTIWSNLPTGITMQVGATERNGLKLGDMTPAQEKAALALVAATLSRDGFQKAMAIVDADQVLEQRSAPTRPATSADPVRPRASTTSAILGKPSATEHVDAAVRRPSPRHQRHVRRDAQNVLTPTHTGAQPASYSVEGKTVRPLGDENDKAFALINALNAGAAEAGDARRTRCATSCSARARTAR